MGNLSCFAVVVPGLEAVAAEELAALSAHDIEAEEGGVRFSTSMDGLFRINLRSRCSTRILLRLAGFRTLSFPELYNKSGRVAWERYVGPDVRPDVRASCHSSRLLHSGRVEQAVIDAIRDRCAKHGIRSGGGVQEDFRQQVLVRLEQDICTLSLDSSGERLDRRGYRLASGRAPLRETIAAGILQWMEWQPGEPLLSPMCGSGTFAIEAALMARQVPANIGRDFAFLHWPACRDKEWQRVLARAKSMQRDADVHIFASDNDAEIIEQARANADRAGVLGNIHFSVLDARKLTMPEAGLKPGLIVCNPPYGDRVKTDVRGLYGELGRLFTERFPGWRMAVLVPDQGCENALGVAVKRRLKLKHGGKWVHVLHVES